MNSQTDRQTFCNLMVYFGAKNIRFYFWIDIVRNCLKSFYRRKLLKVLSSCYKKSDEGTLVQNFFSWLERWNKNLSWPTIPNTWKFPSSNFLYPSSVCLFSITTFSYQEKTLFTWKSFQNIPSLVWKWWHWMTRPD